MTYKEFAKKYTKMLADYMAAVTDEECGQAYVVGFLLQGIIGSGHRIMTDHGDEYCKVELRKGGKVVFEETVGLLGGGYVGALILAWEYCCD